MIKDNRGHIFKIKILINTFRVKIRNKKKIFIIGRGKTGTTSMYKAFKDLGFIVGNYRSAELLQDDFIDNNFEPIFEYCKTAEVFQDAPFNYPNFYKNIDKAFPNSKFILTVRDTPEQWYNSMLTYHSKLWGKGNIPTKKDLENAWYIDKDWAWKSMLTIFNPPNYNDVYEKENLIKVYNDYNKKVIEYFKKRPNDLLVINLSKKNAYQNFLNFIEIESHFKDFPWENKTKDIKVRK